jgi:hypothetical protein
MKVPGSNIVESANAERRRLTFPLTLLGRAEVIE